MLDRKLTTEAAVNRDAGERDVALLKAFMGMVEAWELENAPDEVQAAFGTAVRHLWRQGKRARPRLKRESIPRIELLLDRGLAIEVEGYIEIPCVTEGWEAVEKHRVQTRARKAKLRERVRNAGGTRSERVPNAPPEIIEVSRATNGTDPALKILDPKRVRTSTAVRKKGAPEERLLFDSQETSTSPTLAKRFRASGLPGFDAFWAAYPVHKEKPVAVKAWTELHCESLADLIVAKVELLKSQDDHWFRGFVKYPHRWLRAHGWDDDPIPAPIERLPPRHLSADERQREAIRRSDITFAKMMEGEDERRRSQKDH